MPVPILLLGFLAIGLGFVGGLLGLSRDAEPIYPPAAVLLIPAGMAVLPKGLWYLQFRAATKPAHWSLPPRARGAMNISVAIAAIGMGLSYDDPDSAWRLTVLPIGLCAIAIALWLLFSADGRTVVGRWVYVYGAAVMLGITVVAVGRW